VHDVQTAHRRAHRFVRRIVLAAAVLLPEGPRRQAALREGLLREAVPIAIPAVQPEPLMAPRSALPVALRQEQTEAARPDVPAGFHRENLKAQHRARPAAAAARKVRALQATEQAEAMGAQRLAQAERLVPPALQAAVAAAVRGAQQALRVWEAQPTAVAEVRDVVAGRQPVAESAEVAARPREASAVQRRAAAVQGVAAAVQRRAAAERDVEVAVLPQVAVAAGRLPGAARDAEEVRRRAVQGEAPAARLLAVAWAAAHPCLQVLAWPAPSSRVRSAHARGNWQIARL
jgi:hypothetical protein